MEKERGSERGRAILLDAIMEMELAFKLEKLPQVMGVVRVRVRLNMELQKASLSVSIPIPMRPGGIVLEQRKLQKASLFADIDTHVLP